MRKHMQRTKGSFAFVCHIALYRILVWVYFSVSLALSFLSSFIYLCGAFVVVVVVFFSSSVALNPFCTSAY